MTGPTASQRFEEEVRRWKETGAIGVSGSGEHGYAKLRFWLESKDAFNDRVSDLLWEYGLFFEERQISAHPRGWFHDFMHQRDNCSVCGERLLLENFSFCTHCDTLLCSCHNLSGSNVANGNASCPVCKVGEMVYGLIGRPELGVTFRVEEFGYVR